MADERVVICSHCGSEGRLLWWSGDMDRYGNPIERNEPCPTCQETGGEIIVTQLIELEDMEDCFGP